MANYAVRYSDSDNATVLVCGDNSTLVGILSASGLNSISANADKNGCKTYEISNVDFGYGKIPLVFKKEDNFFIETVERSKPIPQSFWEDYEKILIFLGGLLAASIARAFSVFFDPLLHLIKHQIRFSQTKKFLNLKSSSFVKDVELSDTIRKVARGDFSSNFLISAKFRQKHDDLCICFDDWQAGKLKPEDFRNELRKL